MKKHLLATPWFILLVCLTVPVHATLLGQTVNYDRIYSGGEVSGTAPAVVGGGVEFIDLSAYIDVSDSSFRIDFVQDAFF